MDHTKKQEHNKDFSNLSDEPIATESKNNEGQNSNSTNQSTSSSVTKVADGEKLTKIIEEKDKKIKESEDKYLRLLAEMENLRKRNEKEFAMIKESVNADLILKLVSIADEFEIALSHISKSEDKSQNFQTFGNGIKIIYAKLMEVLKKEGVEEIKSLGEKLDPHRQEVLRSMDGEEDKILEVYQKGYMIKGKVLRAAKVAVGNGNK